jgi:hypothetical protein
VGEFLPVRGSLILEDEGEAVLFSGQRGFFKAHIFFFVVIEFIGRIFGGEGDWF